MFEFPENKKLFPPLIDEYSMEISFIPSFGYCPTISKSALLFTMELIILKLLGEE